MIESTKQYDKPWEQSSPKKPSGTVVAYCGNLPAIRKRKGGSVCTVSHRFNLDMIRGDSKKYEMLRVKDQPPKDRNDDEPAVRAKMPQIREVLKTHIAAKQ